MQSPSNRGPYSPSRQPQYSPGRGQSNRQSGRGSYRGHDDGYGGGMTRVSDPDCCGCFPLECGVRTLFFLLIIGTIGTIVNIIIGAIEEWWYVFIQVLWLIPAAYTICYIILWAQRDNFLTRYKIGNGFAVMAITAILVNLIILFIVIFALEEFYTDECEDLNNNLEGNGAYGTGTTHGAGAYGAQQGIGAQGAYGSQYGTYNQHGRTLQDQNVQNQNVQFQNTSIQDLNKTGQVGLNHAQNAYGYNSQNTNTKVDDCIRKRGAYNNQGGAYAGQAGHAQAGHAQAGLGQAGYGNQYPTNTGYQQQPYAYGGGRLLQNQQTTQGQGQQQFPQGAQQGQQQIGNGTQLYNQYYYNQYEQEEEDADKVDDEIIVNFALLYGGFIIIFGFLGFYWWTVIRRWANLLINQVQPYGRSERQSQRGYDDNKMSQRA